MKIRFLGAAGEVTGSCYLVEASDCRILVECGLFQGNRESELRNDAPFPFQPRDIDAVILSHAHLDHSGRIPRLVKEGFRGTIFAQKATVELCRIMLKDAGYLNEKDAQWERKKGDRNATPLYTVEDAERAMQYFSGIDYGVEYEISPGIRFCLRDAGHILGSSIIELWLGSEDRARKVVFSGDLGHSGAPILREPEGVRDADLVLLEGTYGNRNHRGWQETWQELGQILQEANRNRGNILIPAFAIGRTQELLAVFKRHYREWELDRWQVFLDSPMAQEATKVYQAFRELHHSDTPPDPFNLPNLKMCRTTEESMTLNMIRSGAIIIAGSGMCTGGRIRHHLKNHVRNAGTRVVIVGFQARGTLGRQLVDGAKSIRLWGQDYPVAAKVHTVGGLSAHAGQQELLNWYGNFEGHPPVALIHGEQEALAALSAALHNDFQVKPTIPLPGDVLPVV